MMWSCKFCFKPCNVVYFLQETEEVSTEEEEEKPKITVCNVCLWTFFLFFNFIFLCVCAFVELRVDKDI